MANLQNYLHVTNEEAVNRFAPSLPLKAYSRGMGAMGLPGDLSSASRFVKAAFTRLNSVSEDTESAGISQVFHILGSVAQQKGCVKIGNLYEKTIYTSCCNTTKGIYYYTTYENSQITGVKLQGIHLDSKELVSYPLVREQQIRMENE
jgi:choloylglycine hydrolase